MVNHVQQFGVREGRAAAQKLVVLEEGFAPLRIFNSLLGNVSNLIFIGPMIAGGLAWIGKKQWSGKASGPLQKVGEYAGLVDKPISELPNAVSAVIGENSAIGSSVGKVGGGISAFARKTLGNKVVDRLAQNSLSTTAIFGTAVATEAASTALSFGARIRAIKQMQFDLTGVMPSSFAVLTGSGLHPLVMEARKELTGIKATLGTSLQLGGTIANAALMLSGNNKSTGTGLKGAMKPLLISMGVGMGTNMAASAITASNTALTAYRNLHAHFAQSGRAPESAYEELIGGLAKHADQKTINTFAKQCADRQLPPGAVLKMMAETTFFRKAGITAGAPERKSGSVFGKVLAVGLCAAGAGLAYQHRDKIGKEVGSFVSRLMSSRGQAATVAAR